jgi:hypothetical protein
MRKDLIWSFFAIMVALVMFVVVAYAAEPSSTPAASSVTTQSGTGPESGTKRAGPAAFDGARTDMLRDLPPILMFAALNPLTKNDPEVQRLLDKSITDMQAAQQDETARNGAFEQFVQAERSGDDNGISKARGDLNSANAKLVAGARQFYQQDVIPLRKRIQELRAGGGNLHTQPSTSPSEN